MAIDPDSPTIEKAEESEKAEKPEKAKKPSAVKEVDSPEEADSSVDEAVETKDDETASADRPTRRWRRRPARPQLSRVGWSLVASAVAVASLAGLTGWLGYRAYDKHEAKIQRDLFISTARQAAVNLTTINYTEVDVDVQRIMDSATGAFREDFEKRSQPFIEVVKAAQSQTEGTVTDAGLESLRDDTARVLVAVAVKSRTAGGEQSPREWRMRIDVQSVGDGAKVSNVVFVP